MKTIHPYKIDNRTEEQFLRDMEKGLKKEVEVIEVFRKIVDRNRPIINPEILYVGSSEEGSIEFDKNNKVANVDLFPDYLIKYKEDAMRIRATFVEVKVCNPQSSECFFKVKQLEQYKGLGNTLILFVMGVATDNPTFVLVTPETILNLGIEPVKVYGKETIVVPRNYFSWLPFSPRLSRSENILKRDYVFIKG